MSGAVGVIKMIKTTIGILLVPRVNLNGISLAEQLWQ